jgi:type IV pilus assembly protein PilN
MIRINLLPAKVSKKKQAGKNQLGIGLLVLIVALAGNFFWSASRADALAAKQEKVKRTKAEIANLEKIIGEVNDIKQQQAAVKDKLAVLDRLKANRAGPVRLLDELAGLVPKRVWLKKFEEHDKNVAFEGSASTIEDVSTFMSALQRSPYFTGIELKKTTARAEGRYKVVDFTLSARAEYVPDQLAAAAPGKAR